MARVGSAARFYRKQGRAFPALMIATRNESKDKLHDLILKHTPTESGRLKESIKKKNKRTPKIGNHVAAEVYTSLYYAQAVEHGHRAFTVVAKPGKGLKIDGKFYKEVKIAPHPGAHMFQKGTFEFEQHHAYDIAAKNLDEWVKLS